MEFLSGKRLDHVPVQEAGQFHRDEIAKPSQLVSDPEGVQAALLMDRIVDEGSTILAGATENEVGIYEILRFQSPEGAELFREQSSTVFVPDTGNRPGLSEEGGRFPDEVDFDGQVCAIQKVDLKVVISMPWIAADLESFTIRPAHEAVSESLDSSQFPGEEIKIVGPTVLEIGE